MEMERSFVELKWKKTSQAALPQGCGNSFERIFTSVWTFRNCLLMILCTKTQATVSPRLHNTCWYSMCCIVSDHFLKSGSTGWHLCKTMNSRGIKLRWQALKPITSLLILSIRINKSVSNISINRSSLTSFTSTFHRSQSQLTRAAPWQQHSFHLTVWFPEVAPSSRSYRSHLDLFWCIHLYILYLAVLIPVIIIPRMKPALVLCS